jgi:hypothetical protein
MTLLTTQIPGTQYLILYSDSGVKKNQVTISLDPPYRFLADTLTNFLQKKQINNTGVALV